MLRLALRSLGYGDRFRDKAIIAAHLATVACFPLGIAARRLGKPLPDPRTALGEYVVRSSAGVFACPPYPSPFFLGADPMYEPGLFSLISRLSGGVFVDAGASIGFITVRAASRVEQVIAIEPHPTRFAYLERNVKLNDLVNVTSINCALGDEDGTIALYDIDPSLGPHALDVSTTPGRGRHYDVPKRRLDDLVQGKVSFLKIDVEGDELHVLNGARRLLESRPLVVVESLHKENLGALQDSLPGYSFEQIDSSNYLASP